MRNKPPLNDGDIRLGDIVKWESWGGCPLVLKEKVGRVVRVLQRGENPRDVAKSEFPGHRIMWTVNRVSYNWRFAYLVEVIFSDRSKPFLYKPYHNRLRVYKDETTV